MRKCSCGNPIYMMLGLQYSREFGLCEECILAKAKELEEQFAAAGPVDLGQLHRDYPPEYDMEVEGE